MTRPTIVCEGVSKRYRVKARSSAGSNKRQDFWALRDVSFTASAGEVLGVVGRNGAGKSTMLKILSRIVQPTSGRVLLAGRLAGLLEVGTGFHPELTGRENIFLNGTILGMSRRDVQKQFDSIVDFAGVAFFLETPIKRYSSGMYVRLAFAVAAHLQSEILVLDEVLAVGDLAFQKKCLDKVHELAYGQGRTVLLVSHNAELIRQNATRAVRLDAGRLTSEGRVEDVLREVEGAMASPVDLQRSPRIDVNWGRVVSICGIELPDGPVLTFGGPLRYVLEVDVHSPAVFGVGQTLTRDDDTPLAASFGPVKHYDVGRHRLEVETDGLRLAPGSYGMNVAVGTSSFQTPDLHLDVVMRCVDLDVVDTTGTVDWRRDWWGSFALAEPRVRELGPRPRTVPGEGSG